MIDWLDSNSVVVTSIEVLNTVWLGLVSRLLNGAVWSLVAVSAAFKVECRSNTPLTLDNSARMLGAMGGVTEVVNHLVLEQELP